MNNRKSIRYTYALCSKYRTTAKLLSDQKGTLLDVGSRDCVLCKFLPGEALHYSSADVVPGLDYQIDLERSLPFEDQSFDHVVALDVLEHVGNIHAAFAELLRITRRSATIALPNVASIRHRLSFLFRGRTGTDKYDLPPEPRADRHHWLTIRPQIDQFVQENAPKHHFVVRAQIAETETGALRLIATPTLFLGLHFQGLFSARSIYYLVREDSEDISHDYRDLTKVIISDKLNDNCLRKSGRPCGKALSSTAKDRRRARCTYLRSQVERLHSLPCLIERVLEQIDLVRKDRTHAQPVVGKEASRRC